MAMLIMFSLFDCGIFNALISVIHDNYWCTFNYAIEGYGNNSKELSILRDSQYSSWRSSTTIRSITSSRKINRRIIIR